MGLPDISLFEKAQFISPIVRRDQIIVYNFQPKNTTIWTVLCYNDYTYPYYSVLLITYGKSMKK